MLFVCTTLHADRFSIRGILVLSCLVLSLFGLGLVLSFVVLCCLVWSFIVLLCLLSSRVKVRVGKGKDKGKVGGLDYGYGCS
jgi:hypothetical protein